MSDKRFRKYLYTAMILFFILWSAGFIILHNNFHTIYEIGFVEQSLWNTIQGDFFDSVSNVGNHFANHNSPILFFLLPFYYLVPNIIVISLILNAAIVIGAIPVYKLARKKLDSPKAGFIFALSYLLFPSFYYSNIRSFHPVMLVLPFMGFALYYMHRKNWLKTSIFLFFSMLTNETVSLIVIMIGAYLFFKMKEHRSVGLKIAVVGIVWFYLSVNIIIPAFSPNNNYNQIGAVYGHLGDNIPEVVSSIVSDPVEAFNYGNPEGKIDYLQVLFQHNLFLSLLNPEIIIVAVPTFLQNLLSSSGYKYDYVAHYTYPLIPILFFASITGVRRIVSSKLNILKKYSSSSRLNILLLIILVSSVFSVAAYGFYPTLKENCYLFNKLYEKGKCPETGDIIGNSPKENWPTIEKFVNNIPENASVMLQHHTFSHLSARKETYLMRDFYQCSYADYFILDIGGNMMPVENIKEYLDTVQTKLSYKLIEHERKVYLFKKEDDNYLCI